MRPFNCLSSDCPIFGPHLLEASAGTGKTFSIEHVVVRLLLQSEIEIEQILAVTFTRAATRDLKKRIRSNIEEALFRIRSGKSGWEYLDSFLGSEKAARKLSDATLAFEQCQIYTIHGFCYRMLQEFAFEAGLGFSLKDPDRSAEIPKRICREAKKFLEAGVGSDLLCPEQMAYLIRAFDSQDEIIHDLLKSKCEYAALPFAMLLERYIALLPQMQFEESELLNAFLRIQPGFKSEVKGDFEGQIQALVRSRENPSQSFRKLIKESGSLFHFLDPSNKKVKSKVECPEFFKWASRTIGPLIDEATDRKKIFGCLQKAWKEIEEPILTEEQWFEPDEILKQMRAAVDKDPFSSLVRKKYRAVIVDEFQDTDPLQWEIFKILFLDTLYPNNLKSWEIGKEVSENFYSEQATIAQEQGVSENENSEVTPMHLKTSFSNYSDINSLKAFYLVGDPKQSIYRFRKADIYTYFEARNTLGSSALFCLDTNYRSSSKMIDALNALFDRNWLFLPKSGERISCPPVKSRSEISSDLSDEKGAVHFISGSSFEECYLPYAISEIERLLPILNSPSSFAIIVKDRYQAEMALRLFQERAIPAIAKSHIPLGKTVAFQAVRELFDALAFSKDTSLRRIVAAGPFRLALSEGRVILEEQGFIPFCRHILQFQTDQSEFQRDLKQVIEELLSWEGRTRFSFQGLMTFLDDLEKLGSDEGGQRNMDTDAQAVQILTLHVSKGLEFDVVFAIGLASRPPESEEIDEADAEKLRQLYVAMTRAKKRLYAPLSSLEKSRGALSPMELFCHVIETQEGPILSFLQKKGITVECLPEKVILLPPHLNQSQPKTAAPLSILPTALPSFLHSFTSLSQPKAKEFAKSEELSLSFTPHTIPRGVETGILIHQIFEKLFSNSTPLWKEVQAVESLIANELQGTSLVPWESAIKEMVWKTLNLSLGLESPFSLTELMPGQLQTEMEFLFSEPPHFIKGYIDLVFFHEGKLYFIDWKTNWIGLDDSAYLFLNETMTEHDYWLQAKLYTRALRRYVKRFYMQPFEELFGGAIYLFLRGGGVCHFKPDLNI